MRIRGRAGRQYVILMYHRIVRPEDGDVPVQAGMYVRPETFEEHVLYLKRHFHLPAFSEKIVRSGSFQEHGSNGPACILTFDDGWRDFRDNAFPILERHRVPATVFLPTGYIGTDRRFWSDRLAALLAADSSTSGTGRVSARSPETLAGAIRAMEGPYERRLETAIGLLKRRREEEIEELLLDLTDAPGREIPSHGRCFLNWDEVREMNRSGLIAFGSHTHNHRILVHLTDRELEEELTRSREILLQEGAADPSFIPFCYPNGSWDERVAARVRASGYHATVSTGSGWNEEGCSPLGLRRIAIHQDMTATQEMFGCRIAEIL